MFINVYCIQIFFLPNRINFTSSFECVGDSKQEANSSQLSAPVWVTSMLGKILRSHLGSVGECPDWLEMSATGTEMESGNAYLNRILILWTLDCGLMLICTKENSIIFEAVILFSFNVSQKEKNCPTNTFLLLFSHSVVSNSLRPRGLLHTRLPCPSPSPRVCSNSCPLSRWCHPTISSSVVPFSSCLQSFPASGSFLMSQFFAAGGQSIGASASASVLPMNIQDWSPTLIEKQFWQSVW